LLFGFGLADEFLEAAGAELEFEGGFVVGARGGDEALGVVGIWHFKYRLQVTGYRLQSRKLDGKRKREYGRDRRPDSGALL
jgi:hypothetical protein